MSGEAAEGPWLDPAEAPAGLLLLGPERPGSGFPDELAAVLATGAVAAFVIPGRDSDWRPARELCLSQRTACLVLDDLGLAQQLKADGVHLSGPGSVGEARRRLGGDAVIGAACGRSRHLAMVAGEDGADYVLFGPERKGRGRPASLAETCQWWAELCVIPCAAEPGDAGEDLEELVRAGADFIAVRDEVWGHPAGAAEAALGLRRRIEAARVERQDRG